MLNKNTRIELSTKSENFNLNMKASQSRGRFGKQFKLLPSLAFVVSRNNGIAALLGAEDIRPLLGKAYKGKASQ